MNKKMNVRVYIILILLTLWSMDMAAQRQLVVVNAETKVPVRDVQVSVDNGPETKTAWDGLTLVPDSFERVHFVHPGYERRYVLKSELRSDTVCLLPNLNAAGEVVIWGHRRFQERMANMFKPSPQEEERAKLPQVIPAGANILALAAWIYDMTIGPKVEARARRKKALREVRKKEAELEHRWEMLRDTIRYSRQTE